MKVKMKYFASLRELIGISEEEYELQEGTTLKDLILKHVPERHKEIADEWINEVNKIISGEKEGYVFIVNGDRADLDRKLNEGDVAALLPPVGGG